VHPRGSRRLDLRVVLGEPLDDLAAARRVVHLSGSFHHQFSHSAIVRVRHVLVVSRPLDPPVLTAQFVRFPLDAVQRLGRQRARRRGPEWPVCVGSANEVERVVAVAVDVLVREAADSSSCSSSVPSNTP
jgi:hypothetical protein